MFLLKLLSDLACGVLNAWGGYNFLPARRFIMPVLLGVMASICSQTWWLGVLCLPACGTLCLGYFSGSNWGRALWLFVQACALSSGVLLAHHLSWFIYIPYVIGAGVIGGIYKNWYQPLGDLITGCYLATFIFFIK